jgi:hypothetical protein
VFELDLAASDADGDDVDVSATGLPAGAELDGERGRLSWRPGADDLGTYVVEVIATDVWGAATRETLEIVVSNELPPPLRSRGRRSL